MDDSVELTVFFFLVWPLPETAMGLLCNRLVGALPYCFINTITLGDTTIPLVRR